MKKLFTLFVILALSISVFAQSPQKMSYQCVVRNATGGLVTNHVIGMKISILQGSASGTVVYSETYSPLPQTNANGLVTVEIGSGTPVPGTFSGIDWSAGPYYLKTEADPTGGTSYTVVGTSQLLSVPYAIYAKTAENGFSGNYNDLTNKPILFSGSYNDLTNKPALFDGSWVNISGKPTTISGYGITDAVTITGNQTITGIKAFSSDLSVNGLTIGKGHNAVSSNTTVGNGALYSNTTGYVNTAIGNSALYYNTKGYGNTANGYRALYYNTEGFLNTANGYHALYSNTTGDYNTANGYGALISNTTGSENTANGNKSLYNNTEGLNNTAIGNEALFSNTTGYVNTAIGSSALYSNTEGRNNTAIGSNALHLNTTGDYNTAIGNLAGVASGNLTNANAIGTSAIVNASNKVRIGNNSVTVIEGQVNWSVGSDRRLKENIDYSDKLGLEFVKRLKTVTFTYKNDPNKKQRNGLIAQDVKQVLDQLGISFSGLVESDNEEKTMNLAYAEFVIPLINTVQEQQKQIDELKQLVSILIQK